jgi:hypothetical protein
MLHQKFWQPCLPPHPPEKLPLLKFIKNENFKTLLFAAFRGSMVDVMIAIFANFRRFSSIFIDFCRFLSIFVDFRRFLSIFVDFRQFLSIFVNFRRLSQIFGPLETGLFLKF